MTIFIQFRDVFLNMGVQFMFAKHLGFASIHVAVLLFWIPHGYCVSCFFFFYLPKKDRFQQVHLKQNSPDMPVDVFGVS